MSFSVFQQILPAGTSVTSEVSANDIGIQFDITASGYQLDGYWFYVPAGGDTNGSHYTNFRLYSTVNGTSGTLITGSTVSGSGTFTAGAWNFVALSPGVALTSGTTYVAAVTFAAGIDYEYEHFFWTTGGGSGGITDGPITAPNAGTALNGAQQPFTLPSTGGMPTSEFDNAFYGIDVNVDPLNVSASFSLAMAPLKQSFTAAETISGHFGLAMAPLKQSFTAAEQGANISAHFGLAMAPLKMQFSQPSLIRAGPPRDDPGFKRFRRRRLR